MLQRFHPMLYPEEQTIKFLVTNKFNKGEMRGDRLVEMMALLIAVLIVINLVMGLYKGILTHILTMDELQVYLTLKMFRCNRHSFKVLLMTTN